MSSVSSVDFPNLTTVGADIRASDSAALESLLLPELTDVSGALSVSNNGGLIQIDVDFLQHAGSILIQENTVLQDFRPSRILTVEHDFVVQGNDTLSTLSLDRILTVGGSLSVVGNEGLHTILGDGYQLQFIGGDLVFQNNPLLQSLYGFVDITEIGGSLEVVDNATLASIYGFTRLARVGGHIRLHNNDNLYGIDGFDFIVVVSEEFEVSNNPVLRFLSGFRILSSVGLAGEPGTPQREILLTDLPSLESISAFDVLEEAGALSIVRTGLTEPGRLEALQVVHGDLFIQQNPMMIHLDGFQSIQTVEGTLQLGTNPQLVDVTGLHSVQQVTGDLWVHDNVTLPLNNIDDMIDAIGVPNIDGVMIVTGNGG